MNFHYPQTYQLLHRGSWNTRLGGRIHQLQTYLRGKKTQTNTEQKRGKEKERLPSSGQLASGEQQDPMASILLSSTGGCEDKEDAENELLFIPS